MITFPSVYPSIIAILFVNYNTWKGQIWGSIKEDPHSCKLVNIYKYVHEGVGGINKLYEEKEIFFLYIMWGVL